MAQPQQTVLPIGVDDFVDVKGNHLVSLTFGAPPLIVQLVLLPEQASQVADVIKLQANQSKAALIVPPPKPS